MTIEPPSNPEAPPPPAETEATRTSPSSGYLTATYGCQAVTANEGEALLKRANAAIERAGEHPMQSDLDEILPLLHRAAYGGYLPAQRRYGYYVVGYWFTDEMFWPHDEPVAISALAMVRVSSIADRIEQGGPLDDALREAMASTPVTFADPDQAPALPDEWVDRAVAEADAWSECPKGTG
jgi:hypothetical protein